MNQATTSSPNLKTWASVITLLFLVGFGDEGEIDPIKARAAKGAAGAQLEWPAQPIPEEPTETKEKPTIAGVKWIAELNDRRFRGRVYVDDEAVYILSLHRTVKSNNAIKNFINPGGFPGPIVSFFTTTKKSPMVSEVYALNKETGEPKWIFEDEQRVFRDFNSGGPTMSVGNKNGAGRTEYFSSWHPGGGDLPKVMIKGISTGDIFYLQTDDAVHALDRKTGSKKWKFEAPQRTYLWSSRILVLCLILIVVSLSRRIFKWSIRIGRIILAGCILFFQWGRFHVDRPSPIGLPQHR